MPNQLVLSWTVDVTNSSFGAAAAETMLAAVPLYENAVSDPVLGQKFGLTVASDAHSSSGSTATRTLTLNMTAGATPEAPPLFPAHPRTSAVPVLPYPLRKAVTLPGSFFVSNGSTSVPTTETQLPSTNNGDSVQFLSQEGVFYTIASRSSSALTLTAPYTGISGNCGAFKEIAAPVTLAAIYSTSDRDTAGVATVPAIPAGPGARTVTLTYKDSTGSSFTTTVSLTGRRPAAVPLAGGSIDIAEIENLVIATTGGFGNSIGEITLTEMAGPIRAIPANATPGTGIGAGQGDNTFYALTDEAQLLIKNALAYLPPSYFALAQQGFSAPQLSGNFYVSTGAIDVFTENDQTGALSAGNTIEFADQMGTFYPIAQVTPKIVTLSTPYTGIDTNNTGLVNVGTNSNAGTQGNIGTSVNRKPTTATLVAPSPASVPSNAQLSTLMGQFVATETAAPPLNPPLNPSTVPVPTFLSGMFTRTLQLALAGVPVVPGAITFV